METIKPESQAIVSSSESLETGTSNRRCGLLRTVCRVFLDAHITLGLTMGRVFFPSSCSFIQPRLIERKAEPVSLSRQKVCDDAALLLDTADSDSIATTSSTGSSTGFALSLLSGLGSAIQTTVASPGRLIRGLLSAQPTAPRPVSVSEPPVLADVPADLFQQQNPVILQERNGKAVATLLPRPQSRKQTIADLVINHDNKNPNTGLPSPLMPLQLAYSYAIKAIAPTADDFTAIDTREKVAACKAIATKTEVSDQFLKRCSARAVYFNGWNLPKALGQLARELKAGQEQRFIMCGTDGEGYKLVFSLKKAEDAKGGLTISLYDPMEDALQCRTIKVTDIKALRELAYNKLLTPTQLDKFFPGQERRAAVLLSPETYDDSERDKCQITNLLLNEKEALSLSMEVGHFGHPKMNFSLAPLTDQEKYGKNHNGNSALLVALESGHTQAALSYLKAVENCGSSPAVQRQLAIGESSQLTKNGKTRTVDALAMAIRNNNQATTLEVMERVIKTKKWRLGKGFHKAFLQAKYCVGESMIPGLYVAMTQGAVGTVRALLKYLLDFTFPSDLTMVEREHLLEGRSRNLVQDTDENTRWYTALNMGLRRGRVECVKLFTEGLLGCSSLSTKFKKRALLGIDLNNNSALVHAINTITADLEKNLGVTDEATYVDAVRAFVRAVLDSDLSFADKKEVLISMNEHENINTKAPAMSICYSKGNSIHIALIQMFIEEIDHTELTSEEKTEIMELMDVKGRPGMLESLIFGHSQMIRAFVTSIATARLTCVDKIRLLRGDMTGASKTFVNSIKGVADRIRGSKPPLSEKSKALHYQALQALREAVAKETELSDEVKKAIEAEFVTWVDTLPKEQTVPTRRKKFWVF